MRFTSGNCRPKQKPSADELEFIETQAEGLLILAQNVATGQAPGDQLGLSQLALAFAEQSYPSEDHRIALAWRALGHAHSSLNRLQDAQDSLRLAQQIMERTPEGAQYVPATLSDLAHVAWLRGDLQNAANLYAAADAAQARVGATPLSLWEQSDTAHKRAQLMLDLGDLVRTQELLRTAAELATRHQESADAPAAHNLHSAHILITSAAVHAANGDAAQAIRDATQAANLAATYGQAGDADAYIVRLNAVDQLFVLGELHRASALVDAVLTSTEQTLSQDDLVLADAHSKSGVIDLLSGNMSGFRDHMRAVTRIRKSPLYRSELPNASGDFEFLAFSLLHPDTRTDADVSEALAALQWTHVSRSADAFAMMETRLTAASPVAARLLRARQNLALRLEQTHTELHAATQNRQDTATILTRQAEITQALARADVDLTDAAFSLTGQAPVSPLGLSDIQAKLGPEDVVVTFSLPGLRPELIPGQQGSTNTAIAIWQDGYLVAPVREISRNTLRARITAFRCQMALSDTSCAPNAVAGLRGAMLDQESSASPQLGFDTALAHALYVDLLGGVAPALQDRKRLIIVPPSDLLRLPFAALVTEPPTSGAPEWLIKRHAISILPSLSALAALRADARAPSGATSFLGIGDPQIGSGADIQCDAVHLASLRAAPAARAALYQPEWHDGVRLADPEALRALSRLPDATCELNAIKSAAGADNSTLLTRTAASESFVKRLSDVGTLAEQDIIVFATHGLIAGEASAVSPGLVLSPPDKASLRDDGLLTSAEVAQLNLNAKLVILSACNTASGESGSDEGLSGLASSFFHAGARNVMVTHWAVFSAASAEVSAGVASQIAQVPDLAASEALRAVILGILDDPARPHLAHHPAYWAAFTLVGT